MKNKFILILIVSIVSTFFLSGCTKKENSEDAKLFQNFTTADGLSSAKTISDQGITLALKPTLKDGQKSLLLGYPQGLIGESSLFGAVITKVSVADDEFFGGFKLSSFELPVTTRFRKMQLDKVQPDEGSGSQSKSFVDLVGCQKNCSETAPVKTVFSLPVQEVNETEKLIYLDLAAFGEKLNILSQLNQEEEEEDPTFADNKQEWKHLSSRTIAVDFSYATLVFDLESRFQLVSKNAAGEVSKTQDVTFTSRWYSRLSSALSPYFEPRTPDKSVGYFLTDEQGPRKFIRRFAIYNLQDKPIKYFIKNVPHRYRKSFAGGFEDWNVKLNPVLGHDLFSYEFVEKEDPRFDKIVAGDIRYNVLEWDLDNLAGYGGLGPSTSHPLTGETLAAHVLIQGPTIEKLYQAWFKTDGKNVNSLAKQMLKELSLRAQQNRQTVRQLKLNQQINFSIPAQNPKFHDPVVRSAMDFIDLPEGYSYETYMDGYFRDMVAHELGHNLGLRHNFRGNLGDKGTSTVGSVSRSIMEYLNRSYRHLDRVGDYDVMAIAYGYLGITPVHQDWFCTDEDSRAKDPQSSAECSSSDATSDPFSFLEFRLQSVTDKLVNKGSEAPPDWKEEELTSAYTDFVAGLLRYANSAPYTAQTWTNFFTQAERPQTATLVPKYVMEKLNKLFCNPELDLQVANKSTEEGKILAQQNLTSLRANVNVTIKSFQQLWPQLTCK